MAEHHEFSRLFQEHYQLVYHYILRRVGDDELAADLSGDVFYKAWRGRDRLQQNSNGKAWLILIAKNTLIDHWRKTKEVTMGELDNVADPSAMPIIDAIAEDEARWELMHSLDRLKGNYKSVLVLRFIEGLSVREAAAILKISESNVRTTQFRALTQLREEMGKNGE